MNVGDTAVDTKVGARVVVPSFIACNQCWYCDHDLYSLCETTNPHAEMQRPILGARPPRASTATPTPSAATAAPTPSTSACRSAT